MIDSFQSNDDNLQMPVTTISYHEWLKMLNMYSLQRRSEPYAIIYIYNIVIQLVPTTKNSLQSQNKSKAKQQCITSMGKILKKGSFFIIGLQLYNSISATLRELENDNEGEK